MKLYLHEKLRVISFGKIQIWGDHEICVIP